MKYIVMLGDGMADYRLDALDNKTPLEAAHKPVMDKLAQNGECGFVKTVPDNLKPGSDVANLSVMGYDPDVYYTGRSPLEAASIGIDVKDTDMVFRCNLVTLSDEEDYSEKTMVDYSSDEITTEESRKLIESLNKKLPSYFSEFGSEYRLYSGISYRHCLIWTTPKGGMEFTPPHDITTRKITEYLPKGNGTEFILKMMKASYEILKDDPVNADRVKRGLRPANSMWIWGEGRKPALKSYNELFGVKGAVVSAVDLIKGIGKLAGLDVLEVEGATGNVHTNFKGKCDAAIKTLLDGNDFVYIHVEAADESGHRFEIDNKVKSIEKIDSEILKPLIEALESAGEDYAILLLPDHPTPLSIRTHSRDAVPYVLYSSKTKLGPNAISYNEFDIDKKNTVEKGHLLIKKLFSVK